MAWAVRPRNNQRPTSGSTRVRILPTVVAIVALGAVSGPVLGQSRAESAAQKCAVISDATQRLACYDSLFRDRATASGQAGVAAPATAPAVSAPAASAAAVPAAAASAAVVSPTAGTPATVDPVAEFGLTEQQKERRKPPEAKAERVESIEATVTAAEQDRGGLWRLTLDNGQVWAQTESALGVRFEAGSKVEIRRGALGSFALRVPGRPVIRVRRVR